MKKVLCIGSVTVDVIIRPANSIPTPGTLRAVEAVTTHVGGCAANAAIDLGKLGVPVSLSCKIGEDSFGDFVIRTAAENGVNTDGVVRDNSVSTTVSVVCVNSDGERSFLYYPGSAAAFTDADVDEALVADSDIVFVAGAFLLTAFDGIPCLRIMKRARELGKITVMDTAWDFEDIWLPKIKPVIPYLDWFMPSIDEAAKVTGEDEPDKIADKLFELGAKNVIVKLGKRGALICPAGEKRYILPTYNEIKPKDTTGAGDSFCAGFIAGLAQGWTVRESGEFANAVGTHCIMEIGASTGIKPISEIQKFMASHTSGI